MGERPGRQFDAMVRRRAAGEPLQYVLGEWPFRTIAVMVDSRVLIPRPETEQVVEVALAELDRQAVAAPVVVDLGTGSGAIALSIATERPSAAVWATDISPDALAVAGSNVAGHAARRVQLAHGSWWEALPEALRGQIHLVVSNPPYISEGEMAELDAVVAQWEPHRALDAGPRGTEALQVILADAPQWLAPGGAVVVELAPHQVDEVAAMALAAGLVAVSRHRDLAGRYRAVAARRRPGR